MLVAALVPVWLLCAQLAWWWWQPIEPVITAISGVPMQHVTRPGGSIARSLVFVIHYDTMLTIDRRLVETRCSKCAIIELDQTVRAYQEGRYEQVRVQRIPEYVKPGTYVVQADASWQANPLRRGIVTLPEWVVEVR